MATLDSGTSDLILPYTVIRNLMRNIGGCTNDTANSGWFYCDCGGVSDLYSLNVNFNGTVLEMEPKYWVEYDSSNSRCNLLIDESTDDTALLGNPFF